MHKPLLEDKNKGIMVQRVLIGEISWTVICFVILSLQYLHQLCLEGHLVWGLSFACFCESGQGDNRMMIVLTCLFFTSAGAFGEQVMDLLNFPGHLAHVRRACFCLPRGCPGRRVGWNPGVWSPSHGSSPSELAPPLLKQFISAPPMPSKALHNVIIHSTTILLLDSDSFAGNFLVAVLGEKNPLITSS